MVARTLLASCLVACAVSAYGLAGSPGLAYLDVAQTWSANQRINAGLGVNVAPGATGTLSLSDGIFGYARSVKQGEWTSVPYSAGNFTGNAAMTWTVDSGDQTTYAYMLIGHTMFLDAYLDTTSVGGTPDNTLQLAIPGGCTATKTMQGLALGFDNNVSTSTFNRVFAGGTVVGIGKASATNWSAATNTTYIRVHFSFEVSGC